MSVGLLVVGAPRSAGADVETLLSQLPAHLPAPVVVVLHRGPHDVLAAPLARRCALPVVEPDDKEDLVPGRVYLAPWGYHLLVDRGCVALSVESPEHGCRPAIDALFESAADSYGAAAAGLLFSGHDDGQEGLSFLRGRGGRVAVVMGESDGGEGQEGEVERLSLAEVGGWLTRLAYVSRGRVQP
ncbi:chemotaxis protein CheB [Myxococcus sp. CA056]|uniref:chemotaxis protein CheB n=1 Tax=unclassified Myxococcus TaxID=2648731 RepID=UPI00157A86A3|nr:MULTISPECIES: chemotaxis protein CheB [unclassified Myxococcus]NTX09769.1 chemotaxis protein CheB [Myxococcus sp. CA056]NTX35129.1 chemotaxis protein CheB [Myxococcus sp. CA033]